MTKFNPEDLAHKLEQGDSKAVKSAIDSVASPQEQLKLAREIEAVNKADLKAHPNEHLPVVAIGYNSADQSLTTLEVQKANKDGFYMSRETIVDAGDAAHKLCDALEKRDYDKVADAFKGLDGKGLNGVDALSLFQQINEINEARRAANPGGDYPRLEAKFETNSENKPVLNHLIAHDAGVGGFHVQNPFNLENAKKLYEEAISPGEITQRQVNSGISMVTDWAKKSNEKQ